MGGVDEGWRASSCWGALSSAGVLPSRVSAAGGAYGAHGAAHCAHHSAHGAVGHAHARPPHPPDPWWMARRQGTLGAAPERRRCTPPTGGFSLMPAAAEPPDSRAHASGAHASGAHASGAHASGAHARERAASGPPLSIPGAKHDSLGLHAVQGARLHTLPPRARPPARVQY